MGEDSRPCCSGGFCVPAVDGPVRGRQPPRRERAPAPSQHPGRGTCSGAHRQDRLATAVRFPVKPVRSRQASSDPAAKLPHRRVGGGEGGAVGRLVDERLLVALAGRFLHVQPAHRLAHCSMAWQPSLAGGTQSGLASRLEPARSRSAHGSVIGAGN